jgi:hypothetical protein
LIGNDAIIAVVRGSSGAKVQQVFQVFVEQWRGSARWAGLVAQGHDLPDRACSARGTGAVGCLASQHPT